LSDDSEAVILDSLLRLDTRSPARQEGVRSDLKTTLGMILVEGNEMSETTITHFDPDPDRFALLRECTENYDVGNSESEWPNNILSRKTVVYGCGRIARKGDPVRHNVEPEELALCRRLSSEAAELMAGVDVGMGSESGDPFRAFYIAANADDPVPESIDEALIRSKFGGTIFPAATITVEPLAESGKWWEEVEADASDSNREEREEHLRPWRGLIHWFGARPELKDSAFIRIGEYDKLNDLDRGSYPEGTEIPGSVLPRLAVGLTTSGSLVGLFGYSVQT
jgi:hypothetical protein